MKYALVDSSVILNIFEDDRKWADWSENILNEYSDSYILCINLMIYYEISISFENIEELEKAIEGCGFQFLLIPKEALFLAGKAFVKYRRSKGIKSAPLPDFFIGAHAAVENLCLITRDVSRIKTYFPTVEIVSPDQPAP